MLLRLEAHGSLCTLNATLIGEYLVLPWAAIFTIKEGGDSLY
jgi:hypothetical protein